MIWKVTHHITCHASHYMSCHACCDWMDTPHQLRLAPISSVEHQSAPFSTNQLIQHQSAPFSTNQLRSAPISSIQHQSALFSTNQQQSAPISSEWPSGRSGLCGFGTSYSVQSADWLHLGHPLTRTHGPVPMPLYGERDERINEQTEIE